MAEMAKFSTFPQLSTPNPRGPDEKLCTVIHTVENFRKSVDEPGGYARVLAPAIGSRCYQDVMPYLSTGYPHGCEDGCGPGFAPLSGGQN